MLWAWASLQDPDSLQPLLEPVSSQELEIYQVGWRGTSWKMIQSRWSKRLEKYIRLVVSVHSDYS